MSNRLTLLVTILLLAFLCWLSLPSDAGAPLPEDREPYWEYRVIGDRVLLKNANDMVQRLPCVYKGHDGLGTTWWGNDVRLTWADSSNAFRPSVVSRDSYLHITWMDDRINRLFKIFYKRSIDLGHTWGEDVQISSAPDEVEQSSPDITLSTNCLHAVWGYTWKPIGEQGHIYYRRSTDHGETWQDILFLSSYEQQSKPSIGAVGDTVYVVFTRTIDTQDIYEIHFRKSYDEGGTWTEDRVITNYGPSLTRGILRANEEGLHYVFNHKDNFDDPGNPDRSQEVFYIYSPDRGTTWTEPVILSHRDSIHSQWPSMCVDDEGAIHVTWFDYRTSPYSWTGDIFYRRKLGRNTDIGQTWFEIEILTDVHMANFSNIIASGNHLYLVWEDMRHGSNNYEVYFRHSPDRGGSWRPEERLTNAPKHSYTPVIREQADTLFVVWDDRRHDPTNRRSELYLKRGYLQTISIQKSAPPEHSLYLTSYPNPFNVNTTIRLGITGNLGSRGTSLKLYNTCGRLVKALLEGELTQGEYQAIWDGRGRDEARVSSGVYLCVLRVDNDRLLRRLLYLK